MCLFNNTQRDQKHRRARPGRPLLQLLLPSIIGIVLSFSFLIGTSWAWYTDTALGVLENVNMAEFSCEVSVRSADSDFVDTRCSASGEPAIFSLEANGVYEVKILTAGNATTGYCVLKFWDAVNERQIVYYTDQITTDLTFTYQNGVTEQMIAAGDLPTDILTVETHWGDREIAMLEGTQSDIPYVTAGDVIGNAPIGTKPEAKYDLQNLTLKSSIWASSGLQAVFTAEEGFTLPSYVTVTINNGEVLNCKLVGGTLSVDGSQIPNGSKIVVSGTGVPIPESVPEESVPESESVQEEFVPESESESDSGSDEPISEPIFEETDNSSEPVGES